MRAGQVRLEQDGIAGVISIDERDESLPNTLVQARFRANSSLATMKIYTADSFRGDGHLHQQFRRKLHPTFKLDVRWRSRGICSVIRSIRRNVTSE